MTKTNLSRAFATTLVALTLISFNGHAADALDKVHFLIPGGAGGGWDGTARGTGEALTKAGL
ncbi:MAG: tripartite tricarboxylate transporter substrate binding protein, partial [Gammaproteobacteria bacterium]